MRYEIKFLLDEKKILLDYRRKFMSYIKSILDLYDTSIKDKFYDTNQAKEFAFSVYLPIQNFEKEEIILKGNEIKLFLSIHTMEDSLHFTNAILGSMNKTYPIGQNKMKVISIRPMREKQIRGNSVIFKTMAPIAIRETREGEKPWYHEFNEEGIKILKRNTIAILEDRFPLEHLKAIKITPYKIKKSVINHYSIRFTVSTGIFEIEGRKEILDYLYKCGIGSRSSEGLGMVEVLD